MWVFVSYAGSLHVRGSGSHEVPPKVLGKPKGMDMKDSFSTYATLTKIMKNAQARWQIHVMNDAKELIQ